MSYDSDNKFAVLQEKESPKKTKHTNRNKPHHKNKNHNKNTNRNSPPNRYKKVNTHRNSPSNHKHYAQRKEKTVKHKSISFEKILETISIQPHNGCMNNSCCSIHCDLIHSKYQCSYLQISIHLSHTNINDAQLLTLTQHKIMPFITKYIENEKRKYNNHQHFNADTLERVIISLYLSENNLCGNGCIPLLNFVRSRHFRISTLQLSTNTITDAQCKQICNVLKHIKYPPNEIHLSHNTITNIGFNAIMDVIKYRNDNDTLLSYPSPIYSIKCEPLLQDIAPLWLQLDHNYIKTKDAGLYMNKNNITLCYAENNNPNKNVNRLCCDVVHCMNPKVICYYQKEWNAYTEKQKAEQQKHISLKHSSTDCTICSKARKRSMGKKGKKVVLCKKCREKAKIIDKEKDEHEQHVLTRKVDAIMTSDSLSMDEKIEAMEIISKEQEIENKIQEASFNKTTVVKPWIWGESDDTETSNDQKEDNDKDKDKDEHISDVNIDTEHSTINNELNKEFFIGSICQLPDNFTIPMIHLYKLCLQNEICQATTNEKVAEAHTLLKQNDNDNDKEVKAEIEEKVACFDVKKGNLRSEYEHNMVSSSSTPLFIMCDTCTILRMVGLKKKSVMNYWETMLTHSQKMKYILHFTVQKALEKEEFLSNSEMYQRKLRIEILPKLQLHLNTEEIKSIANDLMCVSFKKRLKEEKKRKDKYSQYTNKYADIIKCQMYRFVAVFADILPSDDNSEKHVWQQLMEEHVFNALGFECPQKLMPRFITEIRKLSKQYEYQNRLETAKTFTLNTLIEKAENDEFGFNIEIKSEQSCILIPHTVTRELEYIKTSKGEKSKGDLWRVQQLCGSDGLLEMLCKKCGCDILGKEHGENHLKHVQKHSNNDYTIISVAEHYSKLLNRQNNLGFVLLTNDKAMHTIASGKGIPVVSLNALNAKLKKDEIESDNHGKAYAWNANYLREIFIKVGFVGGFAEKYLITDALNVLSLRKGSKDEALIQEVNVRRQQVSAYIAMEHGYAKELCQSMALSNELMVTLRDVLQNRDSTEIMTQIYKSKVNNLEIMVRESQRKWSNIIAEYQSRHIVIGDENKNKENKENKEHKSEKKVDNKVGIATGKDIYVDQHVPEMQRFHGDDIKEVSGEKKNNNDQNVSDSDDSDMPPPLNAADQQKLLQMKQKDEGYNANVPLIGGYLAGEELFSRQANNAGLEEEVVVMSQK